MADERINRDDRMLDGIFESAMQEGPSIDDNFLARLQLDMEDHLPLVQGPPSQRNNDGGALEKLRSWFTVSGLAGAAALGVWIGVIMPDTINSLISGTTYDETYELGAFLPSANLAALEE